MISSSVLVFFIMDRTYQISVNYGYVKMYVLRYMYDAVYILCIYVICILDNDDLIRHYAILIINKKKLNIDMCIHPELTQTLELGLSWFVCRLFRTHFLLVLGQREI